MRIRRNASKLLGLATVHPANPCPSPAKAAATFREAEALMMCELNCSPWDVDAMALDPDDSSCCCNFKLTDPKGGEEEGVFGNMIKMEEEEEPISAIIEEVKEMGKKMERKKSKEEMSKAADDDATIITQYCKKSDGKGWHCKRPAQLPRAFCSYHLAQIRSYSSTQRATNDVAAAEADGSGKSHQKTAGEAVRTGDLSFYYYYCGFGPSRGKRRGRVSAVDVKVKEEAVDDGSSGRESVGRVHEDDDHSTAVAGDDEYDLDYFDDDGDDDDDYDYNNGKKAEKLEKKRGGAKKKRGRKPMKCRSLKSLL